MIISKSLYGERLTLVSTIIDIWKNYLIDSSDIEQRIQTRYNDLYIKIRLKNYKIFSKETYYVMLDLNYNKQYFKSYLIYVLINSSITSRDDVIKLIYDEIRKKIVIYINDIEELFYVDYFY